MFSPAIAALEWPLSEYFQAGDMIFHWTGVCFRVADLRSGIECCRIQLAISKREHALSDEDKLTRRARMASAHAAEQETDEWFDDIATAYTALESTRFQQADEERERLWAEPHPKLRVKHAWWRFWEHHEQRAS